MRGCLRLLLPLGLTTALTVLNNGERFTSLYQGPATRGKQGMVLTARPSTHKLARLKFHLLDCVAGQPCSQAISVDPQLSRVEKDELQVQYNGHASPGFSGSTGLFSVIEDKFYQERPGSSPPRSNSLPGERRKESEYLYTTTEAYARPEVQTVPGYSSLLQTRLGVQEERPTRPPAIVSVASSLGRVRGPDYPHRANLAPATLRPYSRPTPPSRWREQQYDIQMREEEERRSKEREEERRNKEIEEARRRREEMEERQYEQDRKSWSYKQAKDRVNANSIHRTTWKKGKPNSPEPIVLRKERYDPFAFQSTPRPKAAQRRRYAPAATVAPAAPAHRLDSRFSIPEAKYVSRREDKPVVISYKEAMKARRRPAVEQETQQQQFQLQYVQPEERKDSSTYYNNRSPVVGYRGGENPIFVSLNKEENQRAPTPPPRHYYPSSSSANSPFYTPVPPPPPTSPSYTTPRLQQDVYRPNYLASTPDKKYYENSLAQFEEVYSPPYESTQPSVDQKKFWQSSVQVQSEESQWPGYGHLMDNLIKGQAMGTGQAYGVDSQPADSQFILSKAQFVPSRDSPRITGIDTNKYVGGPQRVSTRPIVVGPGLVDLPRLKGGSRPYPTKKRPDLQPPSELLSSYSDRYGWTQQTVPQPSPPRNWTSLDLAKPVWEETEKDTDTILKNFRRGQVHQLDISKSGEDSKETFGTWDQSLNLVPAMSRSTEPRPRQWVLLSQSRSVEEEREPGAVGENLVASASLGLHVDGAKFTDS